jgi:hypothetical protein
MIDYSAQKAAARKKIMLALAGLGLLGLLALAILAGVVFYVWRGPPLLAANTPTPPPSTATALPPVDTPTAAVAIEVVVVASPTPTATPIAAQPAGSTPAIPPTATRMPTLTPTPPKVSRDPGPTRLDGVIELLAPPDNTQVAGEIVEFQWRWSPDKGCLPPPPGHAFEIRIWHDVDTAAPMGAMDAGAEQGNIRCDPDTGIRAFTIGRFKAVPGIQGQNSGRARWDVAIIQLAPYQPVLTTQYRTFFY